MGVQQRVGSTTKPEFPILEEAGERVSEDQLPATRAGLTALFAKMPPSRIADTQTAERGAPEPQPCRVSRWSASGCEKRRTIQRDFS